MFKKLLLISLIPFSSNLSASVTFDCTNKDSVEFKENLNSYITSLESKELIEIKELKNSIFIELKPQFSNIPTYLLHTKPELQLNYEQVQLPLGNELSATENSINIRPNGFNTVNTVSKKEILLSLAHPGRQVNLKSCEIKPLVDEIGLRQNLVAWSENMNIDWPDGGPAKWNNLLWNKGTPNSYEALSEAFLDVFKKPKDYAVGCYTAAKLLVTQATLDYFNRVSPDKHIFKTIVNNLYSDNDPLINIEPPVTWAWESDFDLSNKLTPGKLLKVQLDVSSDSVVPGDWLYFINTDLKSSEKTGYEGSNAIYSGLNRFASYYEPSGARYTMIEKANDVFQWRNGVYNRPDDLDKEIPLTKEQEALLLKTPQEGGLLLPLRVVPYVFSEDTYNTIPESYASRIVELMSAFKRSELLK